MAHLSATEPIAGTLVGRPGRYAARRQVYQETLLMRLVESALDPDGLSTTTRAVLARIRRQGRG